MKRESIQKYAFGIGVLFWALTILPSVLFPYWAYLDDTMVVWWARLGFDASKYLPHVNSGRFCPAYWFYYSLIHPFAGNDLRGYYLVQAFVFLGIVLLLDRLGHRLSGNRWAGPVAALLFLTAAPVAENAYTLGKPEPRVLLLLLAAFALFFRHLQVRNPQGGIRKAWLGIGVLLLVSMLTKETSMVALVFGLSGLGLSWFRGRRDPTGGGEARAWAGFFLCAVLVVGATRGLYYALLPADADEAYTQYAITSKLVRDNLAFYFQQTPDIFLLGIAAMVAVWIRAGSRDGRGDFSHALCWTGWAYVAGMLLWRWPLSYYLLVPAGLFAVAFAASLVPVIEGRRRIAIGFLAGVLVLSRLYTIPYGLFVVQAQKAMDRSFTELMTAYAEKAEPGQRLLVTDWPYYVEPVQKSNQLLKIWGRTQLTVLGIRGLISGEQPDAETLKLYPTISPPKPGERSPRKGDFIAQMTGERATPWRVRGVSPFYPFEGASVVRQAGATLRPVDWQEMDWTGWVLEPLRPIPRRKTFSAGYWLFQVEQAPFAFWESGRWDDGWIGKSAVCRIPMRESAAAFQVEMKIPEPASPGRIQVFQEGTRIAVQEWLKPGTVSFRLILSATDENGTRLRFELDQTFVPAQIGTGADDRALGAMLAIKKAPKIKWTGRWSDGWIGRRSVCHVFWSGQGEVTVRFAGTASSIAVPQNITIKGEGVSTQTISIPAAGDFAFDILAAPEGGPPRYLPISLQARQTTNPKALGQSADDRDLAVQISARRLPAAAEKSETTAAAEGTP